MVIDGTKLTDDRAWFQDFASEFYEQCGGAAESDNGLLV
jgi:hypothetical protein